MKEVEVDQEGRQVPSISHSAVETQIEKFLLGKILTVIDASYTDVVQREAVKDLVKDKFHSQLDWMLDRRGGKDGSEPDLEN